jgi:hypothetical protein
VLIKPKIVIWNVKGLKVLNKRLRIKGLPREWKADFVYLLETKMEVITRAVVQSLWGCKHVDWCYMDQSLGLTQAK